MRDAACKGMDTKLFVTDKGVSTRIAKETCMRCSVTAQCSDFAERTGSVGVWGGRHIPRRIVPDQDEREAARVVVPIQIFPSVAPVRIGQEAGGTGDTATPSTPAIAARTHTQTQTF